MQSRSPVKRVCLKCGVSYWDDGCTWCPQCDAASIVPTAQNGMLPDARERVMSLRQLQQDELESRSREGNLS